MQDYSWESVLLQMEKEKIELLARANANKDILFDLLEKNKVEKVFVYFDGSGDSGQITTVELSPASTQPLVEEPAIGFHWPDFPGLLNQESSISVLDAIETICFDFLRAKHLGWETNEGSYGTFEFFVDRRKVALEFSERAVSVYNDEF